MKNNYRQFVESRCVPCGHDGSFYPLDPEHLLTQKAHPELKNDPNVVMTNCRKCHTEKGMKGIVHMANKYPNYKRWLLDHGWEFCEFSKKWRYFKS